MDELRESSLLFSIEGLLETERERVQREGREAERRREDELKRVAEVAERRRASQEEERKGRERREALERERQRLEEERLEAMKRATVERARIEAEGRMRLVEAEEQRKHELSLTRLRGEQQIARYRALSWLGFATSFLIAASALAAYFAWLRPTKAREAQRFASFVAESRAREQASAQALRLERARSEALAERVRAGEAHASTPPVISHEMKPQPALPKANGPRTTSKKPCGDSGDPLDDCLR